MRIARVSIYGQVSRVFVVITRTNYLHFLMFSLLLVLHSLVLHVSTLFEPTTIRCRVHSLFGYFDSKRQFAQPPLVFPTSSLASDTHLLKTLNLAVLASSADDNSLKVRGC